MRTGLLGLGVWVVVVIGGVGSVALGRDRFLIAGGGALLGAGVMVLLWSLMLQALCGSLRAVLREARRELLRADLRRA